MKREDEVSLPISYVERLIAIADRAGVKQGVDVVGPHDTVILEQVRETTRKEVEFCRRG